MEPLADAGGFLLLRANLARSRKGGNWHDRTRNKNFSARGNANANAGSYLLFSIVVTVWKYRIFSLIRLGIALTPFVCF